jgi:DNA adenine methylase
MTETDTCLKILSDSYSRAISQITKPFIIDSVILQRVELVALCLRNRAGVRALLAGSLAKVYQPKYDIRKPYTDMVGGTRKGCFSGRAFDERYIQTLTAKPYNLPINATTAYLTPGFRTKNIVLTPEVELEGRPPEMYKAVLHLFDDVQKNRVSAQNILDETIRLLIIERDKRDLTLRNLLIDIKRTADKMPLAAEEIITLITQHLACKNSARLPVLVIAAAYKVAAERLGERILHLHSHNAADKQTGAAGDIEITLLGDNNVITAYEMKMKAVTIADINIALEKIKTHKATLQHYLFITTDKIDTEVREYAANLYSDLGGVEIAILGCLDFLRHFLHLFHRLRIDYLGAYQELLLAQPDSAVSHTLKETFLTLRKSAEGAA